MPTRWNWTNAAMCLAFMVAGFTLAAFVFYFGKSPDFAPQQAQATDTTLLPAPTAADAIAEAPDQACTCSKTEEPTPGPQDAPTPAEGDLQALETRISRAELRRLEACLKSDFQMIRAQMELYRVQHNARYPGCQPDGSFDGRDFVLDLTTRTNPDGTQNPRSSIGPYLRGMPGNPFVEKSVAAKVKVGRGPSPGDGTSGWYFDTNEEGLHPNDKTHSSW